jgi:hypothetical protein
VGIFSDDPYTFKRWKFPDPSVEYEGVISTTPTVRHRLNRTGNPQRTPEGACRFCLLMGVKTDDGDRKFCVDNNAIARAFNGRAVENNLRRWADQWKVGGRLRISWTRSVQGERVYCGRYTPPRVE